MNFVALVTVVLAIIVVLTTPAAIGMAVWIIGSLAYPILGMFGVIAVVTVARRMFHARNKKLPYKLM